MKRASRPSLLLLLLLAAATSPVVFGCGLNQEGVRPWQDSIGYPASAVLDQSGDWLFVANSNADLRYNDVTLIALRLARAKEDRLKRGVTIEGAFVPAETCPSINYVRPRGESGDFCCVDPLDPYIINCDERRYIEKGATVRIGSFAAGMVRQDPKCGVDAQNDCESGCVKDELGAPLSRLLLAVRGDTSLTYVDVRPEGVDARGNPENLVLDCVGDSTDHTNGEEFAACDDDHRIVETESGLALASEDADPPAVRFPDEPYTLAIDEDKGLLYVGHLAGSTNRPGSGGVSLFDVAPVNQTMRPPRFVATFANIFAPSSTGLMGVTSLRWIQAKDRVGQGSAVFATSRYLPMVTGLSATTALGCPGRKADMEPIREIAVFGSGETYGTTLTGSETRGIQFVKSEASVVDANGMTKQESVEHAFVLQRVPPTVVDFYQTNPNQVIEVCQSPTFLQKNLPENPADERLFVTCFDSGEIFVIDPFTPRVERIFSVGRGPAGLVFPPNDPNVAYVVGFGDNNISVVDIEPGSPSQYHVIQRIGFPTSVPR